MKFCNEFRSLTIEYPFGLKVFRDDDVVAPDFLKRANERIEKINSERDKMREKAWMGKEDEQEKVHGIVIEIAPGNRLPFCQSESRIDSCAICNTFSELS
ncbi:hypothetical protein PV326_014277 [Microctonus aethiopoides]|nr:hypothetical protein PV326_014277 [Microctonus aethiopoides]